MKKSELIQIIKEELAQNSTEMEQNTVVKAYLGLLKDFERNNTDDIYDLKNLSTALEIYNKDLLSRIKYMSKYQ